VLGINVTVPHKERVVPLLDLVSETAQRVGAVNTIVNRDGQLHGENTDVTGFLRALREARFHVRGARVLVVGAGGVARAALAALADGGAASVTVVNRTARRAQRLADAFATRALPITTTTPTGLQDAAVLGPVDLIVNATSLGLHGESFLPLAYAATSRRCLFFDLIYGGRTDFLAAAARGGRRTLDGSSMLLQQGAAAFTLWTGRRAPLAVMRAALHLR
jgi:shikimate dehydrogenase